MKVRSTMNDFVKGLPRVIFMAVLAVSFSGSAQERPKTQSTLTGPPALPVVRPPIERFRELLLLSPAERERELAEKTPDQRRTLAAKLKEYESMTAEERELRLAVTELRWYLAPLMRPAPSDRGPWLNAIPAEKRPLVEDRLQRWDTLSESQQKELLESEMTINYILQTNLLKNPPSKQMDADLAHWTSLPQEQRDRMCDRFQQFFDLNKEEKKKTLGALSEAERVQMEKTLETFQQLPADQRRHCIRAFSKFANMSSEERQQFLGKAELWRGMSPSDRETWRGLVQKLPQMPPLPPGMKLGPPLPPDLSLATNRARERFK